jgi:hypothetical protein
MKPCVLASKNWWKIRSEFSSKNPLHILELKGEFQPTIKETESPLELTLAAGGWAQAICSCAQKKLVTKEQHQMRKRETLIAANPRCWK